MGKTFSIQRRYAIAASLAVCALLTAAAVRFIGNTPHAGVPQAADLQSHNDATPRPAAPSAQPTSVHVAGPGPDELRRALARGFKSLPTEARKPASNRTSQMYVARKAEFWEKATEEQKEAGRELLAKLREALAFPDNVAIRAAVTTLSGTQRDYIANISFQFPAHYREEAQGAVSYLYVTDGEHEVTDFLAAERLNLPTIVQRDVDSDVFFDMFPVRLVTDSELALTGQATLTASDGQPLAVSILSGWSYDIALRDSDFLPEEVIFYDRAARTQPIIHIHSIEYAVRSLHDAATGRDRQATLPVSYTLKYTDGRRSDAYTVALEYEAAQRFPEGHFAVALGRR